MSDIRRIKAIKVLSDPNKWNNYTVNEIEDACKVAVASLKTDEAYDLMYEEPDFCEDCISRKQAIQGLGEQPYAWTDSDFEIQQIQDWKNTKAMLEELPSVLPKCKEGKTEYPEFLSRWYGEPMPRTEIDNCGNIYTMSISNGEEFECKAEDCISRVDAIKAIQDKAKKLTNVDTINGLCGAVAILFDLSPVIPQEPKTGYWIDADGDNAICSCCNRLNHLYGDYCKHCGAKMTESQESEDNNAEGTYSNN